MIYRQYVYARQGLSQPIDFGGSENEIFYVWKNPKLEFDGRCFWNGTDERQVIRYWYATDGEDWEHAAMNVDAGDYWVVRDYQIIEERTKEVEIKTIDISDTTTTWATTSALGDYLTVSSNNWQNMYVSTGRRTSDYIDERFNAFLRQWDSNTWRASEPIPNGNDIELAVMGAIYKSDWREALDQLVPEYINSWEIVEHWVKELRCAGVDGRTHVFNLDMLGVE